MRIIFCLLLLGLMSCATTTPRQVLDPDRFHKQVLATVTRMREENRLEKAEVLLRQFDEFAKAPRKPSSLPLAKPRYGTMDTAALAEHVRSSTLCLGLFFLCPKCSHLHWKSAGAFVIAPGVLATDTSAIGALLRLSADPASVKEGYLIATDASGRAWPIKGLVGMDEHVCLLDLGSTEPPPLALSFQGRAGDKVYCLSCTQDNNWHLTDGIIARYVLRTQQTGTDGKVRNLDKPMLQADVTCDFIQYSSGAPIFDACGNVVAMADRIRPAATYPANKATSILALMHECVAAEEIRALAQPDAGPDVR